MLDWQTTVVLLVVAAAAVYVGWSITQTMRGKSKGCGGCDGCGSDSRRPNLMQIERK